MEKPTPIYLEISIISVISKLGLEMMRVSKISLSTRVIMATSFFENLSTAEIAWQKLCLVVGQRENSLYQST